MKKIIYCLLLLLYSVKGFAYSGTTHLDFNTQYNCGEFVVYINDTDQVNISNIYADITISFTDSSTVPDLTPGTINMSAGYPVYSYSHIRYTDTAFFKYLGSVILDSTDVAHSKYHAYRFIFKNYSSVSNTLTFFNIRTDLTLGAPFPNYKWANYYYKNCGSCIRYPSRLELSLFISELFWTDPVNEYGMIDLSLYSGYSTAYTSMSSGRKSTVTRLLNWLLNYSVTSTDYSTAFSTTIDSLSLPHTFYLPGSVNAALDCPCKSELLSMFVRIKKYLILHGTENVDINYVRSILSYSTYYGCNCAGNYYYFLSRDKDQVIIKCEPVYSGLPYIVYSLDPNPYYHEAFAYSYEFDDNGGASSWPFIQTDPLTYNESTHVFTYAAGFTPFNTTTDFQAVCELPCVDCIASFAPVPGKKYIVSGWVKEAGASLAKTSYTYPEITVACPSVSYTSSAFTPSGAIIDGWQRVEGQFTIPAAATDLQIKLDCSSGDCYFDDIRVFPFDGSMKSYVYDPESMKLVAELDERNYATLYEYDEEGKLVRVKKETEKGVMTIKENRNNTKK